MKSLFYNAKNTYSDDLIGLLIENDRIIDIGAHLAKKDNVTSDMKTIDCKGYLLMPAIIDSRVTLGEHITQDTLPQHIAMAAASSGIGTMINIPSVEFSCERPSQFNGLQHHQYGHDGVRIYANGALTAGLEGQHISEMGLLKQAGALAFTNGAECVQRADVMMRCLSYASMFDMMVIQHAEDTDLTGESIANESEIASRMGLTGAPNIAEVMMIERDLHLLRHHRHLYQQQARYHIAHISTKQGVDAVRRAKDEGLHVTCDTAPPYFALNDTAIASYRTHTKLSPPLRDESDRQAIIEGLKDGTIDVIASDHIPRHADSKRLPYASADFGACGIETLYALVLELYHGAYISCERMVDLLATQPAKLYGLNDLGILAKAKKADFTLIDINKPWQVNSEEMISAKNTPFHERPLQGKVLLTYCNGKPSYQSDILS